MPIYFTAAGAAQTAAVFFTAAIGTSNGTITRTDGQSWIAQGFAVGQMISVSGSASTAVARRRSPSPPITANVITLSPGDAIQTEASAAAPETVTVQTNATITLPVGASWITKGFAVGEALTITGSALNSTAPGQTFTIVAINGGVAALSLTNQITSEGTAASPETIVITNNQSGSLTRTDGGSFIADGFAVGQSITLSGSVGNSTAAGQTFTIAAVTDSKVTLSPHDLIVREGTATTSITVKLQHTTSDTPDAVTAYFTASAGSTPGTIVRTDGGNWLTDGFAVGQTVLVGGSTANSTVGATSYTVTAVTATTLTLSVGDTIAAEASAGTPRSDHVQHIFSYKMTAAQIATLTSGIKEWTPQQLLSLFGAGLLKNVTDTVVTVGAPNIIAANTTILAGFAVGEQTGGTITINLQYPPNAPTTLTPEQQVALAAAERVDVQYLAAPSVNAPSTSSPAPIGTITRTDGGNWSGLAVGEYLAVAGNNGQFTQNQTDGTRST